MGNGPRGRYLYLRFAQASCATAAGFIFVVTAVDRVAADIFGVRHAHVVRLFGTLCLLIVILGLADLTRKVRTLRYPDVSLGSPKFNKAEAEEIRELLEQVRDVVGKYGRDALQFFFDSLIAQNLFAVRAVEEAIIEQGSVRLETAVTFDMPEYLAESSELLGGLSRHSTIVVPIVRAKKGALLDNLTIEDASGSAVPSLSQRETKTLISYVATDLYWRSYVSKSSSLDLHRLSSEQRRILSLILIGVNQIGEIDSAILLALKLMLGAPDDAENPGLAALLISLLEFVTKYYVVAVEVPTPSSRYLVLRHSNELPLFEQDITVQDRLRLYLGLTPYRFTVPLYWPFVAGSYHFSMRATAGQFVAEHSLLRIGENHMATIVRQEDFADANPRPYLRTRYRGGLPYAHFYCRDMNKITAFNLCTRVEFAEVPPGMLGAATAVSLATTLLIAVFAFLASNSDSGLFPLLLASPAFVASYLGFGGDNDSLLRTSLSARFGLFSAGLLSLGSTLLYVAQAAKRLIYPLGQFGLFGNTLSAHLSYPWLYLLAPSVVSSAYLLTVLMVRTHRYAAAARRKGVLDNTYLVDDNDRESA